MIKQFCIHKWQNYKEFVLEGYGFLIAAFIISVTLLLLDFVMPKELWMKTMVASILVLFPPLILAMIILARHITSTRPEDIALGTNKNITVIIKMLSVLLILAMVCMYLLFLTALL